MNSTQAFSPQSFVSLFNYFTKERLLFICSGILLVLFHPYYHKHFSKAEINITSHCRRSILSTSFQEEVKWMETNAHHVSPQHSLSQQELNPHMIRLALEEERRPSMATATPHGQNRSDHRILPCKSKSSDLLYFWCFLPRTFLCDDETQQMWWEKKRVCKKPTVKAAAVFYYLHHNRTLFNEAKIVHFALLCHVSVVETTCKIRLLWRTTLWK